MLADAHPPACHPPAGSCSSAYPLNMSFLHAALIRLVCVHVASDGPGSGAKDEAVGLQFTEA